MASEGTLIEESSDSFSVIGAAMTVDNKAIAETKTAESLIFLLEQILNV